MPASDGGYASLDEAAATYGEEVRRKGTGAFDVLMLGVGPDGGQVVIPRGHGGQVAAGALHAPGDGVHVRVLEAGQHQPTREVDHLGAGAEVPAEVLLGDHREHPAGGDHQSVPGKMGAAVEDVAVAEDEGGGHSASIPAESVAAPPKHPRLGGDSRVGTTDSLACVDPTRHDGGITEEENHP